MCKGEPFQRKEVEVMREELEQCIGASWGEVTPNRRGYRALFAARMLSKACSSLVRFVNRFSHTAQQSRGASCSQNRYTKRKSKRGIRTA